jgi:hypothetical protein
MLLDSHNSAYMAAIIKITSLESELKGLRHIFLTAILMYQLLLIVLFRDSYSQLVKKACTSPALTMAAHASPRLPILGSLTEPSPAREHYEDVPFWTRQEWEEFKAEQKHAGIHSEDSQRGKPKDRSKPNRSLAFITSAEGEGINGYQAAAI